MLAGFFWSALGVQRSWLSVSVLGRQWAEVLAVRHISTCRQQPLRGNEPGPLHVSEKDKLASDDTELRVDEEADVLAGCSATPEIKESKT